MILWPFKALGRSAKRAVRRRAQQAETPVSPSPPLPEPAAKNELHGSDALVQVRRHFFNERGFQTYASFFSHWGGWITAGHCLAETGGRVPPFTNGEIIDSPDGLDAALIGCRLPLQCPAMPREGLDVVCSGYPAGSRTLEERRGRVYIGRPGAPGQWIVHITDPDEPVVTGMSGGPVLLAKSREPIGIIITRNSPADLNHDRDPDESCDFIALNAVWEAVRAQGGLRVS